MNDSVVAPARTGQGQQPVLRVAGLRKIYSGTVALESADLTVQPGEIHGLLGENGAGKSTLVRILAGVETADGGTIEIAGERVGAHYAQKDAARLGCAFIHQNLGLVESLSVAENIALARGFPGRWGFVSDRGTTRQSEHVLGQLGAEDINPQSLIGELPIADKAAVAIARAVSTGSRLLVLDEPTAALHVAEVRRLFALLHRLREQNVACILISHRTDEILEVCDRVTVLRDGRSVATSDVESMSSGALVELIVGSGVSVPEVAHAPEHAPDAFELSALRGPTFGPVSLTIKRGEILGLAGLADSGHGQVAETIYGLAPRAAGQISVNGRSVEIRRPADALQAGISFVPADRLAEGLAAELTARENLFMSAASWPPRLIRDRRERESARETLRRSAVRPPDPERTISTFSGGNQQKILLAKWIHRPGSVLVLREPTAGVDIAGKYEIHTALHSAARGGKSLLVVGSDFEEMARLCHRVAVMRRGLVTAELPAEQCTTARLTAAAYGEEL